MIRSMYGSYIPVAVSERPGYPGRRHARRALGLWVEKNPAPPPNCRALDCLTVGELFPIVPQNNIVVSNKHDWPEFYPGNARACPDLEPPMIHTIVNIAYYVVYWELTNTKVITVGHCPWCVNPLYTCNHYKVYVSPNPKQLFSRAENCEQFSYSILCWCQCNNSWLVMWCV